MRGETSSFRETGNHNWAKRERPKPKLKIAAKNAKSTKILTTDFTAFTDGEKSEIWGQKDLT